MAKIGEVLRKKQPEVYKKLMFMYPEPEKQDDETSFREIENLMRHDGYRRDGGAIRQVRRG